MVPDLKRTAGLWTLVLLLLAPSARAQDAGKLAAELSRLRGEVETLSGELNVKKDDFKARMRSLASQKTELEMELQREVLRLKQLRESRARQKARVTRNEDRKQSLRPVLGEALDIVRAATREGLPFQIHDRLSDLDRLERQLKDGTLGTPTLLARLWGKVEDEFRLARENGLYRQVVPLGDAEVLAEVARVGMVMLFFTTRDGRVGRAVREGDTWSYRLYREDEDVQRVAALFDAFKKRIRVGFFELPAAIFTGRQP
jgi:hypothetical protein